MRVVRKVRASIFEFRSYPALPRVQRSKKTKSHSYTRTCPPNNEFIVPPEDLMLQVSVTRCDLQLLIQRTPVDTV